MPLLTAWTYVEEDGTFYSFTNGVESTLTLRRNSEFYADMYIEADAICKPEHSPTQIHYSVDLVDGNRPVYGLLDSTGTALIIRHDKQFIRKLVDGDILEMDYDNCSYTFSIVGDPDEYFWLTMQ